MQLAARGRGAARPLQQQQQQRTPHRALVAAAAKTTSSRSQTTSSRRQDDAAQGGTSSRAAAPSSRRGAPDRVAAVRKRLSGFASHLQPRAEGDLADVALMSASMAVLVWLSMQLFRLYYWSVLQAGVADMMAL